MRKLIAFFIKNPLWANTIIILTGLFGTISLFTLNKSFFPETTPTRVYVSVFYPGASPEEMEEGLTIKIEQAIKGLNGIEEISSVSQENFVNITVEAYEGTDLDELLQEVNNAVNSISSFPAGAEKPVVTKQKTNGMSARVGFVSLRGPNDLFKLKEIAQKIEDDLLDYDEISEIDVFGYPSLEISVEISEQNSQRYNISLEQIASAINQNNQDLSAGTIKTRQDNVIIRSKARTTKPEEIENIVVSSLPDGQKIRVRDIATVKLQFEDSPNRSFQNEKRNVNFIINKLPEEDLSEITNIVKEYIEKFNAENKENGYEMILTFAFSDMLDERINLLLRNGFFGIFLVLLVLGLFLSIRLSSWVAFGIPFSMLGLMSLGVLYGMTINMISLFGMLLVVGILVDDGIVIAENIYAHFQKGKSSFQAALDGTMEVLPSVFTSVLTTIIAFAVLLFAGSEMETMKEMAFAVVACLAFSLIEAFLVLPSHLSSKKILSESNNSGYKKIRRKIEGFIEKLRNAYGRLLAKMMKRYYAWVYIPFIFILIVIALLMTGSIKSVFFPHIPFDSVSIEVAFQPGTNEKKTEDYLKYLTQQVSNVNDYFLEKTGDTLIPNIGYSLGSSGSLGESGSHAGSVDVLLDIEGRTDVSSDDIVQILRDSIVEDKELAKFLIGGEGRFGKPVNLSISGEDLNEIIAVRDKLMNNFENNPELYNISTNSSEGYRELNIELKPQAYYLGFDKNTIASQIRRGFYGVEAQRLIIGEDEVKIWVRYPEYDRTSINQLESIKIRNSQGNSYPLKELVTYTIQRGITKINHIDTKKQISIYADVVNPDNTAIVNSKIGSEVLPDILAEHPDVEIKFKGQAERAQKSGSSLGQLFMVAIFLIILVLTLNFGSFSQAILIMIVVPIGLVSGITGHGIEGVPVSMLSAWGLVALLGIIINDSVVMLDKYNRNVASGMDVNEAAIDAGKSRFRAIILTSITTVVGLYPILWEQDFQAQFLKPMAISVAYGVLIGTLFILFYFPILIRFYNEMLAPILNLWTGRKMNENEREVQNRKKWHKEGIDI